MLACAWLAGAANAETAITFTLTVTPATISFPDASPSTTSAIPANTGVQVKAVVGGGLATDAWSVKALANGDLVSGPRTIGISSVTWTATRTGGACIRSCACTGGTSSKTMPQTIISGQGSTNPSGVTCTQNHLLANSWTYAPGSYSQTITITASAP